MPLRFYRSLWIILAMQCLVVHLLNAVRTTLMLPVTLVTTHQGKKGNAVKVDPMIRQSTGLAFKQPVLNAMKWQKILGIYSYFWYDDNAVPWMLLAAHDYSVCMRCPFLNLWGKIKPLFELELTFDECQSYWSIWLPQLPGLAKTQGPWETEFSRDPDVLKRMTVQHF